jgi:eukaryotic-like serine/threonine-protein kinase
MSEIDPDLQRAIEHLLDVDIDAPDWTMAAGLLAARPEELKALRVIGDVAAGWRKLRAASTAPAGPPPLFRWGHLDVRERIAGGTSAEVYRAHDAALGIDVALKLHCDLPHSLSAARFLAEAQHLARVRQRNIVGVFGAAVHDGRAGLWCEWIDGHSLLEVLREHGPFAPLEAVYVGIELCHALAALHEAGILHGDLKPGNVLRERGGRIVLVDLGAGGAPQIVNTASADYGTPAYLPPEVLNGAERRPEHDLYALARLIQTLLAGASDAKVPAATPSTLTQVLAHATATNPDQRYPSAKPFHDALSTVLGEIGGAPAPIRPKRSGWWVAVAAAFAFALIASILLNAKYFSPSVWRTDVQLLRRTETAVVTLSDHATLQAGDRLLLELQSSQPTYVYILNEDAGGDLHVLFPLAGLALTNPLAAQTSLRLPGRQGGRELSWEISGSGQREEFLVVLAWIPLPKLERRLSEIAAVPSDAVERSVSRLRSDLPVATTVRGVHLQALLSELGSELADADRVRIKAYRFNDATDAH